MRPAVFLDRDDTLIVNQAITASTAHPGDLFDPELVRLMPGAAEACRRLKGAGFVLVVVTNQAGVARGNCTMAQVEVTNERVREVVRGESGVELDGIYFCPYHPKGVVAPFNMDHPWRKPRPGMLLAAAAELRLDLGRSWMIGDAERDIEAAIGAGIAPARTIIVGEAESKHAGRRAGTMIVAAEIILQR
jgi:D-glycero-D-manno-heptose 1,7-bisphosphate phosphatase